MQVLPQGPYHISPCCDTVVVQSVLLNTFARWNNTTLLWPALALLHLFWEEGIYTQKPDALLHINITE